MHRNHNVAFYVVLSMLSVIVILRKSFYRYLLLLIIALTLIIELLNTEIKKYKKGFSF